MDTHTAEPVAEPAVEPNPVDALPSTEESADLSFTDALDAALAKIQSEPEPEPKPEPEPEPTPTEEAKAVSQEDVTADLKEEPESESKEEGSDLLESLTDDIGDDWTPKAASRFKQLKEELKSNRSEVDQLRQTVKEQESKLQEMTGLVENKDIEALEKQIASYEQDKAFSDLETTDAYRQAVGEPLENLVNQATEIADKWSLDADDLIDVIAMDDLEEQDNALKELIAPLNDRDKAKVYRIIEDVDPIMDRRENLIENAEAALQEAQLLQEQKQTAEAAEKAELRNNVTRNVATRISEKLPFLSGIENFDMGNVQQTASEIDPALLHPVDAAYNAVSAQLLPVLVKEYLSSRKEAEVLTSKLADYENAEPTVGGTPNADSVKTSSDTSFMEALNAKLR
tara:strand:- start:4214 stop:5410 length:1197 start_codon:yes stop_codon:yes gene_type:complete